MTRKELTDQYKNIKFRMGVFQILLEQMYIEELQPFGSNGYHKKAVTV